MVRLRRLAGVPVIGTAIAVAIWNAERFQDDYSAPLRFRVFTLWFTFVNIAWRWVAIILLAQLLDRFPGRSSPDAGKTASRIQYRRHSSPRG